VFLPLFELIEIEKQLLLLIFFEWIRDSVDGVRAQDVFGWIAESWKR